MSKIIADRFVYDDSRTWWYALEPFFWKAFYEGGYQFIGEKSYAFSDMEVEKLRSDLGPLIKYEGKNYSGTKVEQFYIAPNTPGEMSQTNGLGLVNDTKKPEYIGLVRAKQGKLEIFLAAEKREIADAMIEHFDTLWPPAKTVKEDVVPFWFWTSTASGPTAYKRKLSVCKFDEIEHNYSPATCEPLSLLHDRQPPFQGGRLILWHGQPGTGKTYAIRSLVHRWKGWCKAQYIMDPDRFFQSADYMMQVMMGRDRDGYDPDEDMDDPTPAVDGKLPDKNKWNLIIAEDAEEFLREDAKMREGQAIARLLNTTDGLIGQGLKVLILITTNVDIREVHPAIKRSGRCLSNMSFDTFDRTRANLWLQEHKVPSEDIDEMWARRARTRDVSDQTIVLADLYEQLEVETSRRILGAEKEVVTTGQYL